MREGGPRWKKTGEEEGALPSVGAAGEVGEGLKDDCCWGDNEDDAGRRGGGRPGAVKEVEARPWDRKAGAKTEDEELEDENGGDEDEDDAISLFEWRGEALVGEEGAGRAVGEAGERGENVGETDDDGVRGATVLVVVAALADRPPSPPPPAEAVAGPVKRSDEDKADEDEDDEEVEGTDEDDVDAHEAAACALAEAADDDDEQEEEEEEDGHDDDDDDDAVNSSVAQ